MVILGRVHGGTIVPDDPGELPEGALVRIEFIAEPLPSAHPEAPRKGGQWRGLVTMADDFDELPDDLAEGFGIEKS